MDLDSYGFPIQHGHSVKLLGDITVGEKPEVRWDTEEVRSDLKVRIFSLERVKRTRLQLEYRDIPYEKYLAATPPLYENDLYEIEVRSHLRHSVEELNDIIEKKKTQLLSFEYKKYEIKPPYTRYIQLTICCKDTKKIQRFGYTFQLYEAIKELNCFLLEDRPTIKVRKFELTNDSFIYRIPRGLQLSAKSLIAYGEAVNGNPLLPIFPNPRLATLDLTIDTEDLLDFENELVRNAKMAVIRNSSPGVDNMYNLLRALESSEIFVPYMADGFHVEQYYTMIQIWISGNRPIGAICLMVMCDDDAQAVMSLIETRMVVVHKNDRHVTIAVNNSKLIEMDAFYGQLPDGDEIHCDGANSMLKMCILRV